MVEDARLKCIDLYHCKGCGICAKECPKKAITMVDELEARKEAK
jgi:pyruvate ferredoxin oxidoreductase delta subunit